MVYLVEDDKSIRELLVYTLNNSGLPANGFEKPSEFYRELRADDADLIILDIMLPECDGLTMLKNLRADEKTKHIPVMICAAQRSRVRMTTSIPLISAASVLFHLSIPSK